MKKLLITGMSGTLAPVVAEHFKQQGWQIASWDHHQINPEDPEACENFTQQVKPDAICHLAMGSEAWAGWLAALAHRKQIPFVFTSTAMVFDAEHNGPYHIHSERNGKDAYGQYKCRCEDAIWQANPDAMIARLGWQIGSERGGNNMLEFLHAQAEQHGRIEASSAWIPATSHMQDTAAGLKALIERNQPGLYHFDSNQECGWNFVQIVQALAHKHNQNWPVEINQTYVHDQRLLDERIHLRPLSDWLTLIP